MSFLSRNLDCTITSSVATDDIRFDTKLRDIIRSKRSVSSSAISFKDEFLHVTNIYIKMIISILLTEIQLSQFLKNQ